MPAPKLLILHAVPQDSIIGPFLFLIYTNDVVNISNLAKLVLFVDDINMFLCNKNLDHVIDIVNKELLCF